MSFDSNDYLNWYIPLIRKAHTGINLHASGAPPFDFDGIEGDRAGSPWDRMPRLERKLARWLGIPMEELCFASGATGGTLHAVLTLCNPGDELLVETPIYEPMERQAERLGTPKRFTCRMGDGWKLPLLELESQLSRHTGMVMIAEPLNPSGTFRDRNQILALADLAAKRDAVLLINEVYRGYTDARSFHRERDNIVVVSSFSKLLGFYGLRFGWLSGHPDLIARLKAAGLNMSMHPQHTASVGLAVLDQVDPLRERIRDISRAGTGVVDAFVQSTDGLTWTTPEGPGFGCIELPDSLSDDVAFANRLYETREVLVIPGTFFGIPGTIRVSWLQSDGRLQEGLDGIAAAIQR